MNRREVYIVRNSAKCGHCGAEVVSNFRRDKKYHSCKPLIFFIITGGDVSLRRRFFPSKEASGFVETSFVRPRYNDNICGPWSRDFEF